MTAFFAFDPLTPLAKTHLFFLGTALFVTHRSANQRPIAPLSALERSRRAAVRLERLKGAACAAIGVGVASAIILHTQGQPASVRMNTALGAAAVACIGVRSLSVASKTVRRWCLRGASFSGAAFLVAMEPQLALRASCFAALNVAVCHFIAEHAPPLTIARSTPEAVGLAVVAAALTPVVGFGVACAVGSTVGFTLASQRANTAMRDATSDFEPSDAVPVGWILLSWCAVM
jgi:hypothetical protein